jgi:hypothetical protein
MARRALSKPEREPKRPSRKDSIWDKPRIKAMLEEPIGAPVSLTHEEALAIAREAFGKRPDLPPGEEYVRSLRPIWKGLLKRRDG